MTTIADRLVLAQSRIADAAEKCGRNATDIQLLAVSKTKPFPQIAAAYEAGQRHFGENYVQEGIEKIEASAKDYPDIKWHFIGPLQSNKTKVIAEHFHWLHTVSRDKIAKRLSEQRPATFAPLNVCIQVNISRESTKSGVVPEEVMDLAHAISRYPNIQLRGLMAIPTATDDSNIQQLEFSALQRLQKRLQQQFPNIDTLSMGMSNDLEVAIANGSTIVRIGSAIFGART